ncbi:sulfatase family protein [Zobellia alginiliquefaciens]|uniref:sulfatase family protein n=1 Tax=Zobellia alginiliquefaciens TaxID=3032586 RepID=UPI0023E432E1|nr:arylsulfatase [Zobellia alginiliquefaciens]
MKSKARTIVIFSFLGLLCAPLWSQNTEKPNIVIIYTDDQGYGDVRALNPDAKFSTPNIDKIANEGIIFTDGHSSDAVCTPSRYSLLTGRYSWRTDLKKGVLRADGPCLIEEGRTTIGSLLQKNGYNTAMVGKWHLQMEFEGSLGKNRDWSKPFTQGPIEKGFDYFYGIPASMNYGILTYLENDSVLEAPTLWTKKKLDVTPRTYRMTSPYDTIREGKGNWVEVAPGFNDEYVLEHFADKAVAYINENANKKKPFFLYLPLNSPHLPHSTHPDFQGRSDAGNYGAFVEETDYRVGQVLNALKENGIEENTLVIFSSDNGAETNYVYQRDTFGHYSSLNFKGGKRDIYEGGHRVPYLMRWPKMIKPGSKTDVTVCQTDYLATIADIVNQPLRDDEAEDSFSLLPILKDENADTITHGPVIHHSVQGFFAIRDGDWKLNFVRGSGGSLRPILIEPKSGEPKFELYNLANDPSETTNLFLEKPEIVEQLTQKFAKIIKNGRSTPGAQQDYIDENWPEDTMIYSE